MSSCDDFSTRLQAYVEGELIGEEKRVVEEHLAACDRCRELAGDLDRVVRLLRTLPDVPVRPDFTETVLSGIETRTGDVRRPRRIAPIFYRLAASILVVCGIGSIMYLVVTTPPGGAPGPRDVAGRLGVEEDPEAPVAGRLKRAVPVVESTDAVRRLGDSERSGEAGDEKQPAPRLPAERAGLVTAGRTEARPAPPRKPAPTAEAVTSAGEKTVGFSEKGSSGGVGATAVKYAGGTESPDRGLAEGEDLALNRDMDLKAEQLGRKGVTVAHDQAETEHSVRVEPAPGRTAKARGRDTQDRSTVPAAAAPGAPAKALRAPAKKGVGLVEGLDAERGITVREEFGKKAESKLAKLKIVRAERLKLTAPDPRPDKTFGLKEVQEKAVDRSFHQRVREEPEQEPALGEVAFEAPDLNNYWAGGVPEHSLVVALPDTQAVREKLAALGVSVPPSQYLHAFHMSRSSADALMNLGNAAAGVGGGEASGILANGRRLTEQQKEAASVEKGGKEPAARMSPRASRHSRGRGGGLVARGSEAEKTAKEAAARRYARSLRSVVRHGESSAGRFRNEHEEQVAAPEAPGGTVVGARRGTIYTRNAIASRRSRVVRKLRRDLGQEAGDWTRYLVVLLLVPTSQDGTVSADPAAEAIKTAPSGTEAPRILETLEQEAEPGGSGKPAEKT